MDLSVETEAFGSTVRVSGDEVPTVIGPFSLEVLLAEGLVQGEVGQYGLYIDTVDGEDAIYGNDGTYWALMIGGEYALTGADTTPIRDGDSFQLVCTK